MLGSSCDVVNNAEKLVLMSSLRNSNATKLGQTERRRSGRRSGSTPFLTVPFRKTTSPSPLQRQLRFKILPDGVIAGLSLIFVTEHPVLETFTQCLTIQTVLQKLALFPVRGPAGCDTAGTTAHETSGKTVPITATPDVIHHLDSHLICINVCKCL